MLHLLAILLSFVLSALIGAAADASTTTRTSAIITQAAVTAGTPASINRSQLNTYDALNRLIEARRRHQQRRRPDRAIRVHGRADDEDDG